MRNISIRNILLSINIVFVLMFLIFSIFSFISIDKISVNYNGLIQSFYQNKSLTDTAAILKEIRLTTEADKNELIDKAKSSFSVFLQHAPKTTESGVKLTQDLKSSFEKEIRDLEQNKTTPLSNSSFTRLADNFTGLIMKYDIQDGTDFIINFSRTNNIYLMLLATLFLGLVFTSHIVVKKLITARISEVNVLSRKIAYGDLTGNIVIARKDEIGDLFSNISEMQKFLKEIISSVKHDVQLIDESSYLIAEGNQDLSARTSQQASSLQQTAASMEQIKITVGNNSQNAHSANQLAILAKTTVTKGTDVMAEAVSTMGDIENYARQISDISTVINSIANQTNILALNAAVEAARAGEQGRGFAVVASEVRNLATRSGNAAQEINGLINNAVTRIAEGTEQVSKAGEAMKEISLSVSRVSEIMEDITVASDEQHLGINQIAAAVNQMDTVTLQNASLVDASAQSTKNLHNLAKNLSGNTSKFTLEADETSSFLNNKESGI